MQIVYTFLCLFFLLDTPRIFRLFFWAVRQICIHTIDWCLNLNSIHLPKMLAVPNYWLWLCGLFGRYSPFVSTTFRSLLFVSEDGSCHCQMYFIVNIFTLFFYAIFRSWSTVCYNFKQNYVGRILGSLGIFRGEFQNSSHKNLWLAQTPLFILCVVHIYPLEMQK